MYNSSCTSCILWDEIDTFDSVESFNIRKEKLKTLETVIMEYNSSPLCFIFSIYKIFYILYKYI